MWRCGPDSGHTRRSGQRRTRGALPSTNSMHTLSRHALCNSWPTSLDTQCISSPAGEPIARQRSNVVHHRRCRWSVQGLRWVWEPDGCRRRMRFPPQGWHATVLGHSHTPPLGRKTTTCSRMSAWSKHSLATRGIPSLHRGIALSHSRHRFRCPPPPRIEPPSIQAAWHQSPRKTEPGGLSTP